MSNEGKEIKVNINVSTSNKKHSGKKCKTFGEVFHYIQKLGPLDYYSVSAETPRGWCEIDYDRVYTGGWHRWYPSKRKKCFECGKPFVSARVAQKFCSTKCNILNARKRFATN